MNPAEPPRETYWDLLEDVARLQGEMGKDLVAWAQAYEAAGRAFQGSAETVRLMAELGRRMEQYLQSGPPLAVRQALQAFANPMQTLGGTPGTSAVDPFTRFWELWAATPRPGEPPPSSEGDDREGSA